MEMEWKKKVTYVQFFRVLNGFWGGGEGRGVGKFSI